jgi:DNA segregation ATPase FtsK/SpoIIIE, S-DNA-T family
LWVIIIDMSKGTNKKNLPNDFVEAMPNNKDLAGEKIGVKEILRGLKDEKTKQILGVLAILFSIFSILSLLSYWYNLFFNLHDQSLVAGKGWKWFSLNQEIITNNIMGYLGAYFSYLINYKTIGIWGLVPFIYLLNKGLKLAFKASFMHSIFSSRIGFKLLWAAFLFAFVFQKSNLYLGGGMGYYINEWIQNLLGVVGAGLTLLFLGILLYTKKFFEIASKLQVKKVEVSDNTESVTMEEKQIQEDLEENISSKDNDIVTTIAADFIETENVENADEIELELLETKEHLEEDPFADDNKEVQQDEEKEDDFKLDIVTLEEEEIIETNSNTDHIKTVEHFGIDEQYDPWLDLPTYKFPTDDLLKEYETGKQEVNRDELENSKNLIVETLKHYNIGIAEIKATIGPTVTLYEIIPAQGVRISKIKNLEDDIALSLSALGIRIIAPIPGKGTIGIEVPNKKPEMVPMSAVIKSKKFKESTFELPVILGKTITNELYIADLAKMPHLLVAGATGQGKSVGLNCLIMSLLYKKHPTELKFVLVDPKKVELSIYSKIEKHFLAKIPGDGDAIITDTRQVTDTLNSLCIEMDERYDLLKAAGCRNLIEYNQKFKNRRLNPEKGHKFLPYIVCIIDEVADLMMTAGREVETPIARLAQLARAVGIHVILATQRPSVNIITGTIKANFPARIAFRVTSKIDSRTILDNNGADQLIGKGDLLYYSGSELIRLQCPFVDTPEVDMVTEFISEQRGFGGAFILPEAPGEDSQNGDDYSLEDRDELFAEAARIVVETQQGSTSMIQRKLKIGYNRAGRLIDQLEIAGIVGAGKGSKARDVKIPDIESLERYLDTLP